MGRKVKFKSDKHRRAVFAAIAASKAGEDIKGAKAKRKAAYEKQKVESKVMAGRRKTKKRISDQKERNAETRQKVSSANREIQQARLKVRKKAS